MSDCYYSVIIGAIPAAADLIPDLIVAIHLVKENKQATTTKSGLLFVMPVLQRRIMGLAMGSSRKTVKRNQQGLPPRAGRRSDPALGR